MKKKKRKPIRTVTMPGHPRATKDGTVYVHYLAAEKKLGRHLGPQEVVHFVDGNRLNMSPSNLQVFSNRSELAQHRAEGHRKTIRCGSCGKQTVKTLRDYLRYKRHFCSEKCFRACYVPSDRSRHFSLGRKIEHKIRRQKNPTGSFCDNCGACEMHLEKDACKFCGQKSNYVSYDAATIPLGVKIKQHIKDCADYKENLLHDRTPPRH